MKDYKELKKQIEEYFTELNIKYEYIDLEDNDINYFITFNVSGSLKAMNTISGILYLDLIHCSLSMLVLNIYKFNTEDDIQSFYKILNDVNRDLVCGNFTVTNDLTQIIYRCTIDCGKDFSELGENIIKHQINNFMEGLVNLFNIIKKEKQKDE